MAQQFGGRGRGGRGGPRGGGGAPPGGYGGGPQGGYGGMPPNAGGGYGNEYADYGYGGGGYNQQGYGQQQQQQGYGFNNGPDMSSPLDAEIQVVLREIHTEMGLFETAGEYGEQFRNARRILAAEKDKLENNIDPEWIEVDIPKPIKLSKKVLIPNYRHPNFNFVGKVLGQKGATLQNMARQNKCQIFVLGRGSTKDRNKEAELLASGDPQYAHYGGPLHVKIDTVAPAHIAYSRVSAVLDELSRLLQPIREDTTPKDGSGGDAENGNGDGIKEEADRSGNSGGGSSGRGGGDRGRGRGGQRGGGPMRGQRGGGGRGGPQFGGRGGGGYRPGPY